VEREFQYSGTFYVKYSQAAGAAGGIKGTSTEAATARQQAFEEKHPDAEVGGIKPVLTALEILAGEAHTLDVC